MSLEAVAIVPVAGVADWWGFASPYDTGDRCFIDNENLVVKKMTLFATIFTRSDGTETYYFNSQLFNKFM